MAEVDAKKFVDKFLTDKSLRAKMKAAKDDAERKKIATDLGLSFTKEEMEKAYKASKELSDDELDAVAGGSSGTWVGIGAGIVGGGIAAVGAAAGVVAAFATCGW